MPEILSRIVVASLECWSVGYPGKGWANIVQGDDSLSHMYVDN